MPVSPWVMHWFSLISALLENPMSSQHLPPARGGLAEPPCCGGPVCVCDEHGDPIVGTWGLLALPAGSGEGLLAG